MPATNYWRQGASALLLWMCTAAAAAQTAAPQQSVIITTVDETGVIVPDAQIAVSQPGTTAAQCRTDFAGHCTVQLQSIEPYRVHAEKAGFYQADEAGIEPTETSLRIVLAHQQIVREQVDVQASTPGIDPEQVANNVTLNTPEIVNVPYPTSRDVRNLLPYFPGVVQDAAGQIHVDGAETWQALDTLDGFDIRTPVSGTLDFRVSTDAVRTIDEQTTRYPVEFGRATGGIVAFYTGMGDNKFRFNATNFIPGFRSNNGIRFDKFVPRFTSSGPIVRDKAWWFDAVELEYDNVSIQELKPDANNNLLARGSNLLKTQINLTPNNILSAGLLYNGYRSPYDGISSRTPRESTSKREIAAWLPYVRDQWTFKRGALLDLGIGEMRYRDGREPHGAAPYAITPEGSQGSFFERATARSSRLEETADVYLPPWNWTGEHNLRFGVDIDRITYNRDQMRLPVNYLREDRTVTRRSTFAPAAAFTIHNDEIGAYIEDRWKPGRQWLIQPGLRFDWDTIVRRPLLAPRLAAVWTPGGNSGAKISAGIGLYYDHTHLRYAIQPFTGTRFDTDYAPDGVSPLGPVQQTSFAVDRSVLHDPRAVNWSIAVERKLPWSIDSSFGYIQKQTSRMFNFANQSGPDGAPGNYLLTNTRMESYRAGEFSLRRVFDHGYTVFIAYTHSSARTNKAIEYWPATTAIGAQQGGRLPWDTPNRAISWGWLPLDLPLLSKSWDFVYAFEWRSGFPYTAVNAADRMVGAPGAYLFPSYLDFSPGLELRFHFRGQYYGLRGVIENALGRTNPLAVNNVVDSPQFGLFSQRQGRAITARIRLIGSK